VLRRAYFSVSFVIVAHPVTCRDEINIKINQALAKPRQLAARRIDRAEDVYSTNRRKHVERGRRRAAAMAAGALWPEEEEEPATPTPPPPPP
jgi:hypothetical protein